MSNNRKIHSGDYLTVSELNRSARIVLEKNLDEVWVEGELSRVTLHSSGHWYFTLKDEFASIACAMFSKNNIEVNFKPKDGMKVFVLAKASIYEVTGRYQLIVSQMNDAGLGTLQQQFEFLKAKLLEEGLFDIHRKKIIPMYPEKIGVITSPTGAAIRDIIEVSTRRFPGIKILLAPVLVQGEEAKKSIVNAINHMNSRNDIDVLIIGRGGGSLEDLWAFNEEDVARAIFFSKIPIISAVGHEIDFTIADFVADVRAPTPSAAAEIAVPEKKEIFIKLKQEKERIKNSLLLASKELRIRLNNLSSNKVFYEPTQIVRLYREKLIRSKDQIINLLEGQKQSKKERLNSACMRYSHALDRGMQQAHQHIDECAIILEQQIKKELKDKKYKLIILTKQLQALSPVSVLGRGYSITRSINGMIINSIEDIESGQEIITLLNDGEASSIVK